MEFFRGVGFRGFSIVLVRCSFGLGVVFVVRAFLVGFDFSGEGDRVWGMSRSRVLENWGVELVIRRGRRSGFGMLEGGVGLKGGVMLIL